MFKNYFKTAWRNLQSKKIFTLLNIFGLAVGIASCWIIYRTVCFEHTYDSFIPADANVYQVVSDFGSERDSKMGAVSAPLYQVLNQVPGIENIVPVFNQWVTSVEVKRDNNSLVKQDPKNIVATRQSYFKMLPYKWLAGNAEHAINDIGGVVLTKSRADMYFPNQPPQNILNKTITYFGGDTIIRKVTGIVADLPGPSHFTGAEFIFLKETVYRTAEWTNTNGSDHLFLQLKNGTNINAITDAINKLELQGWAAFAKERKEKVKRSRNYILTPIRDLHFATDIADYFSPPRISKRVLNGVMGIGIFLLALACINYINMGVAQVPQRGKEVGIRKTLGSTKAQLIYQFLFETVLTVILACVVAIVLSGLGFSILRGILPEGMRLYSGMTDALLFGGGVLLFITLFAGMYPAWLIAKLKAVDVFKNFGIKNYTRFSLQKVLIVFQFVIALVFIICTVVVSSQLRFILHSDVGFNKDAVLLADVPWQYFRNPAYKGKETVLLNEIKKIPGVEAVLGSVPLSTAYSSSPFEVTNNKGELVKVQVFKKGMDKDYLDFYKMKLLAGRNIFTSDTLSEVVLNETAVKQFGFSSPDEAVGKLINQLGEAKIPIVGVVKDFHTQDFYKQIEPLALLNNWDGLTALNIRVKNADANWLETVRQIEKKWYRFYPPDTFNFKFFDESLEAIYKRERQISTLISVAAGIMIFVSCLGLFGLATLMAWQRTKEIGIRKVLGAHVAGIIILFVKDYIKLIFVAIVIAAPIAWWTMHRWLTDFTYRIQLQWWMFAVAGIAVILLAIVTIGSRALKVAMANPVKSLRTE